LNFSREETPMAKLPAFWADSVVEGAEEDFGQQIKKGKND
jgi:hypothetical protein